MLTQQEKSCSLRRILNLIIYHQQVQHILRALYQSCFVWGQALISILDLPSPEQWGWQICEDQITVKWTALESISKVCKELCKCSCKKECSGRCSCKKMNLPCTSICSCHCSSTSVEEEGQNEHSLHT